MARMRITVDRAWVELVVCALAMVTSVVVVLAAVVPDLPLIST